MQKDKTKRIIALSCSPSRGRNSDTLLDKFIEGFNSVDSETLNLEKIYLEDIEIKNYNYQNGKGPVEGETEFAALTEKIQNSDALIIATPTYNFSVPAHLKNFIDRMRFFALDLEKKNKIKQPVGKLGYLQTYFIVSGGTPDWAQKILFFAFPPFWMRGVFLYYGANVMGAMYTGDVKAFKNEKILKRAYKKGMNFAKCVSRDKHNRILERIFFRPPQIDATNLEN